MSSGLPTHQTKICPKRRRTSFFSCSERGKWHLSRLAHRLRAGVRKMPDIPADSSSSPLAAASAAPQADAFWSLRFKDAGLETSFIAQMRERDRPLSRNIALVALISAVVMHVTDFFTLPDAAAMGALLLRLPLFLACWGLYLYASVRHKLTPGQPWLVFVSILLCISCLALSLSVSWENGVPAHYQPMLAIPLFVCLASGLPWRLSAPCTLLAAAIIAAPEWHYQPNIALRNLHIGFLTMAAVTGIFGGFVIERHSRRHFLTNNRYLEQSRRDALTGLPNRRELDQLLPQLLQQCARDEGYLAVAMFDVDYFKAYNDHYGHSAGDTVLIAIAQAISQQAWPRPDFVARYGGEEFVAVWRHDTAQALPLGEGLRQAVARLGLPHELSPRGKISISVGAVALAPTPQTRPEDVLAAADHALYRAKEGGRDRVEDSNLATVAWPAHQHPTRPAGRRQFDNPSFVDNAKLLPHEERRRFARERGLYERHQLFNAGLLCLLLNLCNALVSHLNLAEEFSRPFVSLILSVVVPSLLVSLYLARQDWALRRSRYLLPFVIFIPGLCYSYAFYYALSRGGYVPYEIILISLYQIYIVGGQSWIAAALASWLLSALNVFLYLHYTPSYFESLTSTASAFILINIVGTLVGHAQDLRALDSFIKKGRLQTLALHDSLTGLANRTGLERHLAALAPALAQGGQTFTVAMADIDHFKDYNDYYGHAAGDTVLSAVAHTLQQHALLPNALAVRYGGEEFLLLWRAHPQADLATLGENLCAAIRTLRIPHSQSRSGLLTISAGLARTDAPLADIAAINQLITDADRALYRAKSEGRDRVAIHIPTTREDA